MVASSPTFRGVFLELTIPDFFCQPHPFHFLTDALVHVKEHYYVPSELARLFEQVGFSVEHVWGGTAGNWGRRKIQLDEIEVMVVARKGK
jgi:hypothetical protein